MQDQSFMTLPNYPWTLKIFIAAFFDAFFVKWIGKCKTYILLCGIGKFVLLFFISWYIDDMVKNLEVSTIAWVYFGLNVFSALESVSVDAWVLTLLSDDDLPKGAIPDSIGQTLGVFLTYSIFGSLSSTHFLNKFIFGENYLKNPIMDLRTSHQVVAYTSLLSMIFIMLTVSEKHIKRASFCEVVKLIPDLIRNKAIISFICFIFVKYFGQRLFGSIINFYLIEKGYSYDYIIIIGTVLTPLGIACTILSGKWLKRGQNQRVQLITIVVGFFSSVCTYFMCRFYSGPKDDMNLTIWIIVTSIVFCVGGVSYIFDVGF